MQQMNQFIRERGGRVRFDVFAREHLLGEKFGYYSTKVDMTKRDGTLGSMLDNVFTPSVEPKYAQAVSGLVAGWVAKRCQMTNSASAVFAEIGGGAGNFKKAFLEQWPAIGGNRIRLEYISVEPNPNHRAAQSPDGTAIKGTAQKTNLPDASVDFLFDEEVLDCMPFRIMKYDGKQLQSEAFVIAREGAMLELKYDKVERDELASIFEMYLSKIDSKAGTVVFSNDYEAYWKESMRVLKPGGSRFSIDYVPIGKLNNDSITEKRAQYILRVPYREDLTHLIDYRLQNAFAYAAGFGKIVVSGLASLLAGSGELFVSSIGRQLMGALKPGNLGD